MKLGNITYTNLYSHDRATRLRAAAQSARQRLAEILATPGSWPADAVDVLYATFSLGCSRSESLANVRRILEHWQGRSEPGFPHEEDPSAEVEEHLFHSCRLRCISTRLHHEGPPLTPSEVSYLEAMTSCSSWGYATFARYLLAEDTSRIDDEPAFLLESLTSSAGKSPLALLLRVTFASNALRFPRHPANDALLEAAARVLDETRARGYAGLADEMLLWGRLIEHDTALGVTSNHFRAAEDLVKLSRALPHSTQRLAVLATYANLLHSEKRFEPLALHAHELLELVELNLLRSSVRRPLLLALTAFTETHRWPDAMACFRKAREASPFLVTPDQNDTALFCILALAACTWSLPLLDEVKHLAETWPAGRRRAQLLAELASRREAIENRFARALHWQGPAWQPGGRTVLIGFDTEAAIFWDHEGIPRAFSFVRRHVLREILEGVLESSLAGKRGIGVHGLVKYLPPGKKEDLVRPHQRVKRAVRALLESGLLVEKASGGKPLFSFPDDVAVWCRGAREGVQKNDDGGGNGPVES